MVELKFVVSALSIGALLIAGGCGGGPAAVPKSRIDVAKAVDGAMSQYDKDGDKVLSGEELEACPGIQSSLKDYDKDGDKQVSADELGQRLQELIDAPVRSIGPLLQFKMNGRFVEGATVELIPEKFLEHGMFRATGTTDQMGMASVKLVQEGLPEDLKDVHGVPLGLYRVSVTHPRMKLPASVNTETTLGLEIDINSSGDPIQFKL